MHTSDGILPLPEGATTEIITIISRGGAVVRYRISSSDIRIETLGLDFNTRTGIISGTPTAVTSSVFYIITAHNDAGQDSVEVIIVVVAETIAPMFSSGITATIAENSGTNQEIYTTIATDASGIESYRLGVGVESLFSINVDTNGEDAPSVVILKSNPNFETQSTYTFDVIATDSSATANFATQRVTLTIININEDPIISGTDMLTVVEDSSATMTLTATNPDEGTLAWSILENENGINGTAIVDDSGKVTYTSIANRNGRDTFTVQVSDGSDGASGTTTHPVTVSITAVNDLPIRVNEIPDQTATTTAEFSYTFPADTFADADGADTLMYTASVLPPNDITLKGRNKCGRFIASS